MGNALLDQLRPIFVAEGRERLQAIGAGLLRLEQAPGDAQLVESIRREAHSLKGASASLGLGDLEKVAHAIENAIRGGGAAMARDAIEVVLRALDGADSALSDVAAGGEGAVTQLDELLRALNDAVPTAPPPAAAAPSDDEEVDPDVAALSAHLERLLSPDLPEAERGAEAGSAAARAASVGARSSGEALRIAKRIEENVRSLSSPGPDLPRAAAALAGDLVALRSALRASTAASPAGATSAGDAAQPAPPPGGERAKAGAPSQGGDSSIRVSSRTLESLARQLELVALSGAQGERRAREVIVADQGLDDVLSAFRRVSAEVRRRDARTSAALADAIKRLAGVGSDLRRIARAGLRESEQQRLVATTIRDDIREMRLVPAAMLLEPLRWAVRDVAGRVGKKVELSLGGLEVQIDRRVADELKSPLLHLVRNAVDHGIEAADVRREAGKGPEGRIEVRVEPRGRRVAIVVADDGAGLSAARIRDAAARSGAVARDAAARLTDDEAVRLAFRPGVTTAEQVTAISGRGVGLDVVHETVTRLQGSVDVATTDGKGTKFTLDLPLTLAGTFGILFRLGGDVGAFPAEVVKRVLRVAPGDVTVVAGEPLVRIGDARVPWASLGQALGVSARPEARGNRQPALLLAVGNREMAVAVDEVLGQVQLVVSSLGACASQVPHLVGAAVLDDGRPVAVLNAADLLRRVRPRDSGDATTSRPRILVADDSLTTRAAMKSVLELAGYAVLPVADGAEALEVLRQTPCALVVSDIQMPRLDGIALTKRIRSDPSLAALRVILVTSLDSPKDRALGLEAGADAYVVKQDVERGALLERVRELLPDRS